MSTVGLAMIARDAEDTIGVCLKSVEGIFDQVVVVDTGSTDKTIEIAQTFGADIYQFEWVYDFSAARNFSFEKLQTDWAFWLDADDLLIGAENFDTMLARCEDTGLDGTLLEYLYSFDAEGERVLGTLEPSILQRRMSIDDIVAPLRRRCITTQYRERLVKNDPLWRWQYPIHEALPAAGRRLGRYDGVKVVHRRHIRRVPAPSRRNLDILDRVPPEARDERIWFYYGLEYSFNNEPDKAIEAFEKYLPLSTLEEERYLACHWLGDLYRRHRNDLGKSMEYDLRAVSIRPTWRDAYAGLLESSVRAEDWPKAIYYGAQTKRAEIPDTPYAFNPLHEEVGWVGDYVRALVALGQVEEARLEVARALTFVPEDVNFQHNLDVISIGMNLDRGKQSVAETVEFFIRHDDAETAAMILSRLQPELRDHPSIKRWIAITGDICGKAARGGIVEDTLKVPPGTQAEGHQSLAWEDTRVKHLDAYLAQRPYIRRVLQVGGPLEVRQVYDDLGIQADRASFIDDVKGDYDAVILWSCLERVRRPDDLVEAARRAVRPAGEILAYVPNGPARRGLAPPEGNAVRLRAYSIDTFRRVMGTVKLPDILPGWAAEAGDLFLSVLTSFNGSSRKDIAIVCPNSIEVWGPHSLGTGVGGSEEAVIRLSRAFARRGHGVVVYGSGWSGYDPDFHEGRANAPEYRPIQAYKPANILLGWRYPEIFLNQIRPLEAEWRALWLHDSVERARVEMASYVVDCIWAISDYHAGLYSGIPKVYKGRNGIDSHMMPTGVKRNHHKAVYVSTPFRGLDILLEAYWPHIKAKVPDAELHCYYGWESADRMGVTSTKDGAAFKERVMSLSRQDGVIWHGRIGQPDLYKEMASAGVWLYPSRWKEEHCISAYLAQALGAWPVVFPLGALPQSVVFGWKVGPEAFVDAAVDAMSTEDGREEMMEWTRRWTTWDDVAQLWEVLWSGGEA